ncbi:MULTISPECIES: SIS domain-containing protein [unclassified Moorena]|uniref:SIS domain-containing protein n=1 Tax=unclassified Moorena TaxID=2683338 RepID=UPI0013C2376E|nr:MULTISPECIES: SIS domain-containing protein [unclassified Moorena]NEP33347.1 SIS domain-containing protein [Moorena sp. SIO3B2]NET67810.1 SIS domain-containing protein [Moorena sp. SIO1G6]
MSTEQRVKHPFHIYEAILAQPQAFAHAARCNERLIDQCAARIASCERLFTVGIGTSHYAAQVGEHLMRLYGGELFTQAVHSFDFALYGLRITPRDCVIGISHRGNKLYTVESLKHAREAGCYTVFITGEGGANEAVQTDITLTTVAQDKSSAHTVSYIGAISVLSALAERIGYHRTGASFLTKNFLHHELPEALLTALETENEIALLAHEYVNRRRIWLVGGGPNAVTAHEIALKIKETSYLQAEGMSIETILHGPFQCAEAEDLFVLIAPAGAAQGRVIELVGLIQEIGAASLVISDGTAESLQTDATSWVAVPKVPEPFCSITCLVPLQLFTYYLALERGTNPDGFRLEDPRFARARSLIRL